MSVGMICRAPTVEELTAMILESRREPGIWRAETQAKWLAKRIARHMAEAALANPTA